MKREIRNDVVFDKVVGRIARRNLKEKARLVAELFVIFIVLV